MNIQCNSSHDYNLTIGADTYALNKQPNIEYLVKNIDHVCIVIFFIPFIPFIKIID